MDKDNKPLSVSEMIEKQNEDIREHAKIDMDKLQLRRAMDAAVDPHYVPDENRKEFGPMLEEIKVPLRIKYALVARVHIVLHGDIDLVLQEFDSSPTDEQIVMAVRRYHNNSFAGRVIYSRVQKQYRLVE